MAQIGRHPVAAVVGFFVVGLVVVFGAFLLLVRSSDPVPIPSATPRWPWRTGC
jgi:hypothetical protein